MQTRRRIKLNPDGTLDEDPRGLQITMQLEGRILLERTYEEPPE